MGNLPQSSFRTRDPGSEHHIPVLIKSGKNTQPAPRGPCGLVFVRSAGIQSMQI